MSKRNKIIVQIIIILLLVGGLGFYFYNQYQKSRIEPDNRLEIIQEIVTLRFIKEDLKEEAKEEYRELFRVQAEHFLDNPDSPAAFWPLIKIEQIKQIVGDYNGAKQALIWAVELQPKSHIAHGNLANLYFHHYDDFAKAEEHYLKAIAVDSVQAYNYYLALHEIYRYFYKQDTTLAEDILKQGIERYPQETNLMAILAHYYKDLDRKEEAREYYLKILEINPDSQVAKRGLESL